jgi:hypothetical protein
MRALADEIAGLVETAGAGIAFPARLRVLCEEGLAALLPPILSGQREWPHSSGAVLLAASVGMAWAESQRGGQVVVIAGRSALDDGLWWEAAALADRLRLSNLTVLITGGDASDRQRMRACGWQDGSDAGGDPRPGPRMRLAGSPMVSAAGAALVPAVWNRDWHPVHLASLPQGALPPWPQGEGPTIPAVDRWLAWMMQREPRLLVPHLALPWNAVTPTPAALLALAQVSGEGYRVCWRPFPPRGLIDWLGVLDAIGRQGLPFKLLVPHAALPALLHLQALPGWWVMAPADRGEAAAVIAHALDTEHATLIALPEDQAAIPPWPSDSAYMPGTGRLLAPGVALTLVCDQAGIQAAYDARVTLASVGVDAGVFHCTSVHPLPAAELTDAAQRAPMLVCALHGRVFAGSVNAVLCAAGAPPVAVSAWVLDQVPPASQIVAQARGLIAAERARQQPPT